MHFEKYLHNGIKSLKKKDFLDAINNLEEYISHNDKNHLGYYYLGLAYIFRELYDEAYKYISKSYKLNENDTNTVNALGFLNLKYNNVDEAINYWLDILDMDERNYIAKRNLEKVKKSKNIEKLVSSALPDEYINFKVRKSLNLNVRLPKFPKFPGLRPNHLKVGAVIILSAVLISLICIYILNYDNIKVRKFNIPTPKNLQSVDLRDMEEDYIIDKSIRKSMFNLKPEEIKKIFYNTKKFVQKQSYNKAIININKILHSNAGIVIKERFKILKGFTRTRKTFQLNDNIPYSTLMNLPLLYEDTQVVWEGKIEDIRTDEDSLSTTFSLFVRENRQSIGMVKVVFKKIFTNLTNGKKVMVSGKFLKLDEKKRIPVIEGIGIKRQ